MRLKAAGPRRPGATPVDGFIHGVRLLSQACGYFAAALIAFGVFVVCEMVFVRYVLNQTTIWQTDLTTYCLVAATFIGSPYVLSVLGHADVDVLSHYACSPLRYGLAIFAALVTLCFAIALAILTFVF